MSKSDKKWFKLDNAALVFMPAASRRWTAMFRISAVMKEAVDPEVLQAAANDLVPRFPSVFARIKRGLFWYFLETSDKKIRVTEDKAHPCQKLDARGRHGHLIRILYYGHRISFESFHVVTDGGGGLMFFKSLLRRYLELKGVEFKPDPSALNYLDNPSHGEVEDAFHRYARVGGRGAPLKEIKSYQLNLKNEPYGILNVIHGEVSADALHKAAKSYGLPVGQFLLAVLGLAVSEYRRAAEIKERCRDTRPLRLTASVDLRKRFPTESLRNFSTYFNITAPDGEYTLESFAALIKERFAELDADYMQNRIDTMTGIENKFFIRIIPLFLKDVALNLCYNMFGESLSATGISNFGRLDAPDEFASHVERFETMMGPTKTNNLSLSCVTYGDKTVLTFSSRSNNRVVEKNFFRTLASLPVEVAVDSNFAGGGGVINGKKGMY